MSDETKMNEQQDAQAVEQLRQFDGERPQGVWYWDTDIPDALRCVDGSSILYAQGDNHGGGVLNVHTDALSFIPACSVGVPAAIRIIDRQAAEIKQLRTEMAKLREDVDVVATGLESAYVYSTGKPERWGPGYEQVRHILRNAFTAIRAALGSDGNLD